MSLLERVQVAPMHVIVDDSYGLNEGLRRNGSNEFESDPFHVRTDNLGQVVIPGCCENGQVIMIDGLAAGE